MNGGRGAAGATLVVLATVWGASTALAQSPTTGKGNLDRLDDPKIVRRLSGADGAAAASPSGPASVTPAVGANRGPSSAGAGGPPPSTLAPGAGLSSTGAAGPPFGVAASRGPALGPAAGGSPASPTPGGPASSAIPSGASSAPVSASAVAPPSIANAAPAPGAAPGSPEASAAGVVAARAEPPAAEEWPFAPRAEVSWRRLPLFRPGAQQDGQASGKVSDEGFSVLSGRIFPTSSLLRFGLAFDFGWEDGRFAVNGDYFLAETTSFGVQHLGRVTPFVEALGGGGYMRRLQTGVSVPSAIWFFGGEGGADFYVASRLYVHASLGFVRVVNGLAQVSGFTLLHEDTWTFRLGFGI